MNICGIIVLKAREELQEYYTCGSVAHNIPQRVDWVRFVRFVSNRNRFYRCRIMWVKFLYFYYYPYATTLSSEPDWYNLHPNGFVPTYLPDVFKHKLMGFYWMLITENNIVLRSGSTKKWYWRIGNLWG